MSKIVCSRADSCPIYSVWRERTKSKDKPEGKKRLDIISRLGGSYVCHASADLYAAQDNIPLELKERIYSKKDFVLCEVIAGLNLQDEILVGQGIILETLRAGDSK